MDFLNCVILELFKPYMFVGLLPAVVIEDPPALLVILNRQGSRVPAKAGPQDPLVFQIFCLLKFLVRLIYHFEDFKTIAGGY